MPEVNEATFVDPNFLAYSRTILYSILNDKDIQRSIRDSSDKELREFLLNPRYEKMTSFLLFMYSEDNDALDVIKKLKAKMSDNA